MKTFKHKNILLECYLQANRTKVPNSKFQVPSCPSIRYATQGTVLRFPVSGFPFSYFFFKIS